jgi:hydroxylamine reductase (hybrid-cluster protein)
MRVKPGRYDELAKEAYSGWAGWHHHRHWPTTEPERATKIKEEAINEAHKMREEIERLRQSIRKCEAVAGAAHEQVLYAYEEKA